MHILKLVQTLNELLQHILIRVYHLHGVHNAALQNHMLLQSFYLKVLVCSSFAVDVDYKYKYDQQKTGLSAQHLNQ